MPRQLPLILILVAMLTGSAVALAQDATTQVIPGELTELASVTELTYGDTTYQIGPEDGTVAVGFVTERATTTDGSTIEVVLFVHDHTGWRAVGVLTGAATGPLSQTIAGDVLTLAVIGASDE